MIRNIRDFNPVAVFAIQVTRRDVPTTVGPDMELIETGFDSYYIEPDEARAGQAARRLSFAEAILRFTV